MLVFLVELFECYAQLSGLYNGSSSKLSVLVYSGRPRAQPLDNCFATPHYEFPIDRSSQPWVSTIIGSLAASAALSDMFCPKVELVGNCICAALGDRSFTSTRSVICNRDLGQFFPPPYKYPTSGNRSYIPSTWLLCFCRLRHS